MLLEAITRFLLEDLNPTLAHDKALQFRVLIAANLTNIVAAELRTKSARFAAEGQRVAALLNQPAPSSHEALETLNATLAARLRAGEIDEPLALRHLVETAKETLAATNPRFDVNDEI
jgi:hypothetical protein